MKPGQRRHSTQTRHDVLCMHSPRRLELGQGESKPLKDVGGTSPACRVWVYEALSGYLLALGGPGHFLG